MASETHDLFRSRRHESGAIELWASGWRLEIRFLSLVPLPLAGATMLSSVWLPLRVMLIAAFLGGALVLHRLTRIGIVLDEEGVELVDVLRTRRAAWDQVAGFVGERNAHDGRCAVALVDGRRLPGPAAFSPEEMNPYGEEGDLSAIDTLNRIVDRFRRGLDPFAPPSDWVVPHSRLPRSARLAPPPRVEPRAPEPVARAERSPAPVFQAPTIPAPQPVAGPAAREWSGSGGAISPEAEASSVRFPWVPRPPQPDPEPEPKPRRFRRRRAEDGVVVDVRSTPHELTSPGARRLAGLDKP